MKKFAFILLFFSLLVSQEFVVTNASRDQKFPVIASDRDCFMIVWEDQRYGIGNTDIFGVAMCDTGRLTPIFAVFGPAFYNEIRPAITTTSVGGEAFVTWLDYASDPTIDTTMLMSGVISCSGVSGSPTVIARIDTTGYESPAVAFSGDVYLNVWMFTGSRQQVKYAVLDTLSSLLGSYGTLSGPAGCYPDVAFNRFRFLVVWHDSTSSGEGIYAQYFDSAGMPIGSNFLLVNHPTATKPAVFGVYGRTPAESPFIIVWQENEGVTGQDIYVGKLTPPATTLSMTFPVVRRMGDQENPDIASDRHGFLIVWQDNRRETDIDIYGKYFNENLLPRSRDTALCTARGAQIYPQVAYSSRFDKYMVVWQDRRSSLNWDIYAFMLDESPIYPTPYVATALPFENEILSCDSPIVFYLALDDPLDTMTVQITYGYGMYTASDREVWIDSNKIFFHPDYPDSSEETLMVCLVRASDISGDTLAFRFCRHIIWDDLAPRVVSTSPSAGATITSPPLTINGTLNDVTKIILDSLVVNGRAFQPGDTGFSWNGINFSLDVRVSGVSLPETNIVCVHARDKNFCPNELHYCWRFLIRSGSPPSVVPHIPTPGSVTACSTQSIQVLINDPDGVDPTSIRMMVDSVTYNYPSHMTYTAPLLTFTLDTAFNEGEINVSVEYVEDVLGYHITSPVRWSFIVDRSPPTVDSCSYPEVFDTTMSGDFLIYASDAYTDSLTHRFCFISLYYHIGGLIRRWRRDSLLHPAPNVIGVEESKFLGAIRGASTSSSDTFRLCARLADGPKYCRPNMLDTCWRVIYISSGISEPRNIKPTIITLTASPNPFNSSVKLQYSVPGLGDIKIFTIDGKLIYQKRVKGEGTITWFGKSDDGMTMPSGVYIAMLTNGTEKQTCRMLLIR